MNIALKKKVKKGTLWVVMERIFVRIFTLVRVPILAYLLSPRDFGLMGIITTILLFIDVITRTGFDVALIQKNESVEEFIDVGWSLSVLKSVIQSLVLLFLALPVAKFYTEPSLSSLFVPIIAATLLSGFNSMKMVQLIRELRLGIVTIYHLMVEGLTLVVTIGLAFLLRNVWALAFGMLAKSVFELVFSYLVAPYRPKFDLDLIKAKELWSFGKWVLLSGVFLTLFMHGDDLFVGKLLGVVALGFYTMAYKIGNMITTELVDSLRRVFFPAFSSLQNNIAMLRRAYLTTYHITTAIGGVFSVGLFWLAPEFVSVLLGEKWLPVIPVLRVLAIWGGVQMLSTNTAPLFRAVGRPDWWAKVQALKFSLLAVLIYPLSVKFGILGTAFAVLIASSLEIPVGLWWTREALVCKWRDLLQPILLSLIGTLSVSVIYVIMGTMLDFSDFLHLLFYAPMLLGFYIITVYFVDKWLNMGALASVRIALSG